MGRAETSHGALRESAKRPGADVSAELERPGLPRRMFVTGSAGPDEFGLIHSPRFVVSLPRGVRSKRSDRFSTQDLNSPDRDAVPTFKV